MGHLHMAIASATQMESRNKPKGQSDQAENRSLKCHFEHEQPNLEFLPKTLKKRNIIFPKYPIQAYSSCCLWFYGEIECLLRSNDYSTYEQIFNSLKRQSIDFYINVINILSKEFEGNECIIRKEKEAFTDKNAHDIDLNRLLISHGKNYYSVHKDIIFSKET